MRKLMRAIATWTNNAICMFCKQPLPEGIDTCLNPNCSSNQ
ncbi:hypothetical protein [Streptomyces sp. NPDC048636]